MARLPQPGSDAGSWGSILNDFLTQSLTAEGELKNNIVGAPQLKPQSVTASSITDGNVTNSKLADGSVTSSKLNAGSASDGQVLTYTGGNLSWGSPSGSATVTADQVTETASNKVLTAAERTKLAGIPSGATVNATDAQLRDRSTHTGTQTLSTISGVTATTAELNYLGGVTLSIQSQLNNKISGVASTDNAIARFNGTTGAVQDSSVILDDTGKLGIGVPVPTESLHVAGNAIISGTVNGRTMSTDGTKLDGIQAGAQVNTVTPTNSVTLTNKTLTTPIISDISNVGLITLPATTTTLVGRSTTDTLTNKTITSPTLTDPVMNATTIVTDTTTGLKIGTNSTQKLGFFNATPLAQPAATSDLGSVLSALGLRAAGTAYPITTSAAVSFTGTATITNIVATSIRAGAAVRTGTSYALGTTNTNNNLIDASAGAFTVTLPATATLGHYFTIKKIDSSPNAVTIVGTFDGATNYVLSKQYDSVTIMSSTTAGVWYIGVPDLLSERTAIATLSGKSISGDSNTITAIHQSSVTNLTTDIAAKTNATTIAANGMGVVVHGAVAGTARPTEFAVITWIGSVAPTNAVTNDVWMYKA
ncbi:MAG: hypothetical protein V4611_05070 [Patescibacteria group bacterium]